MSLYRLWVRSEWRRRWPSLLGLAAIVAVAGGAVLVAVSGARRAESAFDRFGRAVAAPTLLAQSVGPEGGSLTRYDGVVDELGRIRAIPGVEHVEAAAWMALSADPSTRNWFAVASVASDRPDAPISSRLVAGRMPDPAESDVIVVNEVVARDYGVGVGDRVPVGGLAPDQARLWLDDPPDTPAVEFDLEVVGVVRSPEDISDAPEPYFAVTEGFYRAHRDEVASCICVVFVRATPGAEGSVVPAVADIVGPYGMAVTAADPLGLRITHAVAVEVNALRLGAAIAGLAGLLLLILALLRQASETVDEVGVRRALGLGPRHEAIGAAAVTAPAVIVGIAGALVLAVALSPLLPQGRARLAEPDPGVWWEAPVLLGGALALALVTVLAAAGVGWVTARRARAVERPQLRHARHVRGAHLPAPASLGIGFATDPGRDRLRVAAWSGLAGVALAVGAVTAVTTIRSSTDHLLTSPGLFGAAYDLEAQADEELAALAAELPGVEQVALRTSLGGASYALAGPHGQISVDPDSYRSLRGDLGPRLVAGRRPGANDEVLIGPRLARDLGVGLGEDIAVVGADGATMRYRVVGHGIDAGVDVIDSSLVMREDGLTRLCELSQDAEECQPRPDDIVIDVADNAEGRAAAALLIDRGAQRVAVPSIVGSLDDVGTVPAVLAVLLGLLGVIALLHGLLVALRRRRRDLGVARALGFTPGQAASTLRWQAGAVALAGGAIGLLFGLVAGRVMWRALATGVGAVVAVQSPPGLLLLPLLAVLVALVAAAWPAHRAARLRPAEALRSE